VLAINSLRSSAALTRFFASLSKRGKKEWSFGTKNFKIVSIFMSFGLIKQVNLFYESIEFSNRNIEAPIRADTGIVRIQAQKTLKVTPHFTADAPFRAPAPIIAPVITCVVLTGIPKCVAPNKVIAPADSAQKPSNGLSLVIFCPIVFTILHPPRSVPNAIAAWHESTIQRAIGSVFVANPDTIRATQIMPIDFWASLPPWPRLNAAAESN
jgi:hypothetical protein